MNTKLRTVDVDLGADANDAQPSTEIAPAPTSSVRISICFIYLDLACLPSYCVTIGNDQIGYSTSCPAATESARFSF